MAPALPFLQMPESSQPRWAFKIKRDADGNVARYKARWVAERYLQRKIIDFDEMYVAAMQMKVVRSLIAFASIHGLELNKTAYLNAAFDQEECTSGATRRFHEIKRIGRLLKALYGTNQAGRQ